MNCINNTKIPIAFIIFNRPEKTIQVFEEIKKYKPNRLFIIADGPRYDRKDDQSNCEKARNIIETIDWECEVLKYYSDVNLGCGKRISSGLDWVFQNCEEAIILEDDCVPSQAFFRFCGDLLIRYKYDTRIMHISGSRFNMERMRNDDSYLFSRYVHIWGWATWKRAWQLNDHELKLWPVFRDEGWVNDLYPNKVERRNAIKHLNDCYTGILDTWDFQWAFTVESNNGLSIMPKQNLIRNIGVGESSTHVIVDDRNHTHRDVSEDFVITKHPLFVVRNRWYDAYHYDNHFIISVPERLKIMLRKKVLQYFHIKI
jgi:hypothetical protein